MIKIIRVFILFLVAFATLIISCAIQKREGDQFVPNHLYDLSMLYDDKEKAFLLRFKSQANDEICIPEMSWTDENGGHYFFGDKRIYFINNGIRYDIKDLDYSDHCTSVKVNGCIKVLKKGDQAFGKLPIEDFVVSSEVYLSKGFDPQLHYSYTPRFCTTKYVAWERRL